MWKISTIKPPKNEGNVDFEIFPSKKVTFYIRNWHLGYSLHFCVTKELSYPIFQSDKCTLIRSFMKYSMFIILLYL